MGKDILLIVIGLVIGVLIGFFLARFLVKKTLNGNSLINEEMIENLMLKMGRKPSKKQVNQIMNEMNKYNKKK